LRIRAFLNAQPATRNFQLACFEFVATHIGWVVKAIDIRYSPVANRQSLFSALRVHCHFDGFVVTGVDGCLDCLLPLGKREFVGDESFEQ